jgi:hypothetical protein
MSDLTARAPSKRRPVSEEALVFAAAFAVSALVLLNGVTAGSPRLETFGLIFASITIEALPFILVGALVSAALAVCVSGDVFNRIGRLPLHLQIPGVTLAGFAFPVCECGSVPVARRLMLRGVHPAAGLSFIARSSHRESDRAEFDLGRLRLRYARIGNDRSARRTRPCGGSARRLGDRKKGRRQLAPRQHGG